MYFKFEFELENGLSGKAFDFSYEKSAVEVPLPLGLSTIQHHYAERHLLLDIPNMHNVWASENWRGQPILISEIGTNRFLRGRVKGHRPGRYHALIVELD